MKNAQSHVQFEPEIYEHSSAGVGKHRISAERRIRKPTADDDNEGLAYSEEELIKEEKQVLRDMRDGEKLPE